MSRIRTAALALLLAAVVTGCEDPAVSEPEVAVPDAELEAGLHPELRLPDDGRVGGEVKVEVRLRAVRLETDRLGSFQGELTYDRDVLGFKGAEVAAGVLGAWNETEPGVLRFAGVSVEGAAASAPVLVLTFEKKARITEDAFTLRMEEVTAAEGLRDLTPSLRKRPRPLFSVGS